ncbi:MAG: hypothetical protein JW910_05495, partial [Anaerolineae bacterium]|nr:hypothetical protein [Anaerolineae bacterium]
MKSRKLLPLLALVIILTIATGAAYAQNSGDYTVGYFLWWTGAFINEMTALGYIDGENITYLSMSYEGFDTMTPEEAAESMAQQTQAIIDAHPDVIVINTDTDAVNMRAMAGDIPIVFARSDDPVATGAVEDLIQPGGYTTGIITNQHHERRLQLLVEILPSTDA